MQDIPTLDWGSLPVLVDCPHRYKGRWCALFAGEKCLEKNQDSAYLDTTKTADGMCNLIREPNGQFLVGVGEDTCRECMSKPEEERNEFRSHHYGKNIALILKFYDEGHCTSGKLANILAKHRSHAEAKRHIASIGLDRQTRDLVADSAGLKLTAGDKLKGIVIRAKNLTESVVEAVKERATTVSAKERRRRIAICKACPLYADGWCGTLGDTGAGRGCGCNLRAKVKLSSSRCSEGKW